MIHWIQLVLGQTLKGVIGGRIRAMSIVHSLFVETRWIGAELSAIATQELAPYLDEHDARVRLEGPETLLKPDAAQAVAVILHELVNQCFQVWSAIGHERPD
jgi:two-component sensor histidine kinase